MPEGLKAGIFCLFACFGVWGGFGLLGLGLLEFFWEGVFWGFFLFQKLQTITDKQAPSKIDLNRQR